MEYLGIDFPAVEQCYLDSFAIKGDDQSKNTILEDDRQWSKLLGISIHPSITINNITYRGDPTGYDIFKAVCAGF